MFLTKNHLNTTAVNNPTLYPNFRGLRIWLNWIPPMEDISSCHESIYMNTEKTCTPRKIFSDIQTLCGFCNLHSNISVTPHFPLSTNLWKSKLEKKPFQRKKCLSSIFSLRRCTLIRIGRNDEKNQHLQEKWTLSIIKEKMKGWSARLEL